MWEWTQNERRRSPPDITLAEPASQSPICSGLFPEVRASPGGVCWAGIRGAAGLGNYGMTPSFFLGLALLYRLGRRREAPPRKSQNMVNHVFDEQRESQLVTALLQNVVHCPIPRLG